MQTELLLLGAWSGLFTGSSLVVQRLLASVVGAKAEKWPAR